MQHVHFYKLKSTNVLKVTGYPAADTKNHSSCSTTLKQVEDSIISEYNIFLLQTVGTTKMINQDLKNQKRDPQVAKT